MIYTPRGLVLFVSLLLLSPLYISQVSAQAGDVDPNGTQPNVCIELSTNLRYRDNDETTQGGVSKLQNFLIGEGYMKGEATGFFGTITFASVQKYQIAKGLTNSGYVATYTRTAIKEDTCGLAAGTATQGMPASQNQTTVQTTTTSSTSNAQGTQVSGASGSLPLGVILSDTSDHGCYILLGKSTCLANITWAASGYASTPNTASLRSCEVTSSNSCVSAEESYIGVKGTQPFTLKNGVRRIFAIWGHDFLGRQYKTGELVLSGKCVTGSTWNGSMCSISSAGASGTSAPTASSQAVFGPSGTTSQPVTYGWRAYAGPMLGAMSPSNLGYAEPAVPCTQSNVGASYNLGLSSSGVSVIATCAASNQSITDFVPATASTLNTSTSQSGAAFGGSATQSTAQQNANTQTTSGASFGGSATVTCSYSRGTFINEFQQTVAWACGCPTAPADGAIWVTQANSCYHSVIQ